MFFWACQTFEKETQNESMQGKNGPVPRGRMAEGLPESQQQKHGQKEKQERYSRHGPNSKVGWKKK